MTIFNVAKLPLGSFKNVEFHIQENEVTGGRKTITHEYPSSKNRYVEDLSGIEKIFNIQAWTDDNISFNNRDDLIRVLEEGGVGTLIHPKFGELKVVSVGYSISDSITQLGISKFTLNFEVASNNVLPEKLKANKGLIANLKTKLLGQSEAAFDNNWKTVVSVKSKFDSANETLKKSAREIKKTAELVQGSTSTFSDFVTSINQIISSSTSLIQSPEILSSNLTLAFNNLAVAYNSSQDVFDVSKRLFGFNQRDRVANGLSQLQKDIRGNQDQINNYINVAALALAYNAASNIDYRTLDELNNANSDLEEGFYALPTNLDREVRQTILDIRVQATNVFTNLAISLPNVANYEVLNPISLNVLVYSLYGSLDLKNTIRDLNNFQDTSTVSGTIKILTNV